MNIEELTIKQVRELQSLFGTHNQSQSHPFEIGKNYFIRTVTHHYTGKLLEVYPTELVLVDVAWIADEGRFANAMKTGEFDEVEPWPDGKKVIIGRGSIIDASFQEILPRIQK